MPRGYAAMRCSALGHQGSDELRDNGGHLSGRQRRATQRAVVLTHDQSTRHPSPCRRPTSRIAATGPRRSLGRRLCHRTSGCRRLPMRMGSPSTRCARLRRSLPPCGSPGVVGRQRPRWVTDDESKPLHERGWCQPPHRPAGELQACPSQPAQFVRWLFPGSQEPIGDSSGTESAIPDP
jgi:hypothetical protein